VSCRVVRPGFLPEGPRARSGCGAVSVGVRHGSAFMRHGCLLTVLLGASVALGQTAAPASSTARGPKSVAGKPAPARPGTSAGTAPGATDSGRTPLATPENPVFIDCDKARMEGATQRFVCTGHVKMVRNTTTLTCDRSIGHYLGKDATQVTRLECFGNVQAVDGERWARGDHADYDTVKEVLVLTGNPEARQGTNTMKGDRVVFYVDTDLIEVERVKGVLESKGKEPGQKKGTPAAPTKAP